MQVEKLKLLNSNGIRIYYLQTPLLPIPVGRFNGRGATAAPCPSPIPDQGLPRRACHRSAVLSLPQQVLDGSHHLLPLSPPDSNATPGLRPRPPQSPPSPFSCRISTTPVTLSPGTTSASLKAAEGIGCAEAGPCSHAEKHTEVKWLL